MVILIIKRVNYIIIFSIFLVALFGCKSKTETPPDVGYDYAPTNIGKYVVYDVDSTVYDDFHHDTTYYKFRIKEQLAEAITDNEGRATVKLIRYIKQYNPLVSFDNIAWTLKDVWSYTKTNTTLEVVEEDIRFTKLIFPATADAIWDGNARNTIGEWDYKYIYVNTAETINGANFDNVLYVEQKDDKNKNAIHRQFYIEKYAKNVGLVYREIKDLYSNVVKLNPNGTIKPVEQRIEKGVIYKLTYVTHGSE